MEVENKTIDGNAAVYQAAILNDFLAGICYADHIFDVNAVVIPFWVKIGLIKPVDSMIDYTHPRWSRLKDLFRYTDGKSYCMDYDATLDCNITIYNTYILAQEGLEDILSLYKKNQWNWESLLDYAMKTTRDFNGDGVIDQHGLETPKLMDNILLSNNVRQVLMNADGLSCGLYAQKAAAAFNLYREITFVHKLAAPKATFNNGTVALSISATAPTTCICIFVTFSLHNNGYRRCVYAEKTCIVNQLL